MSGLSSERRRVGVAFIAGAVVAASVGLTSASANTASCVPGSATLVPVIAMNAGGPQLTTGGRTWTADAGATGGSTWRNASTADIAGTTDDDLYRTERWGTFTYELPVSRSGDYLVRLHLAEIYWNAPGGGTSSTAQRIQTVNLEGGSPEMVSFDVGKEAGGPMRAVVRGYETRVTDGKLTISAAPVVEQAKLSAVEVARIDRCVATTPVTASPGPTATPTGTSLPRATTTATPTVPSSRARFAPSSFWYADLRGAPTAANSTSVVSNVVKQATSGWAATVNTHEFSAPIYVATASTPRQDVSWNNCQNKSYDEAGFREQMRNVPIPPHALPAAGTDKEVIFYSPAEDTLWELWVASKSADGKWSACWGGKLTGVSKGHGAFAHPYGITAAGLSMYGGTIRVEELQRGSIDHAIGLALPNTATWPTWSWPANRTDGYNPSGDPNVPMQGQRLRLDPSLNVDALNLHPVAKTIAKAAQKHGFIVWDTAGAVSVRAENPLAYTTAGKPDPYATLYGGKASWEILRGFPGTSCRRCPRTTASPEPDTVLLRFAGTVRP